MHLLGSRGIKAHLGMNIGTRTMGRRGWHAHVDFLGRGRWCSQFFFGKSLKAFQTVRKGLGFCFAMIFGFAALVWDVGAAQRDVLIASGVDQEVVVI